MPVGHHLRALLIAVHLVIVTIAAVPTPEGRLTPRNFRDPDVQESLRAWAGAARAAGTDVSDEAFAEWAWGAGRILVDTRATILAPFRKWMVVSGTGQSWRMFGHVNRRAALLEVHVERGGAWKPVYVELGEPRWMGGVIDQSRVRAVREGWGLKKDRKAYRAFVAWLAARAHEEWPDATALRARYQGVRIGPPAEVRAGGLRRTGVFFEETVPLGAPAP